MSVPPYEIYKETGVDWLGAVPSHWELPRFKLVLRERPDRSVSGSEELLSVSAYTGVTPRSEIVAEGDHLSRAESLEGYKLCFPGDLVMNIMLAWNRGLGVTRYAGLVSPAYSVFQIADRADPAFIDYLTRSEEYVRYFKAFSAGVIDSRLRLYPDVFGGLTCILPPLAEQTAIGAFLGRETGKIDALVEAQRRLIDLLKEKRQAVISHAVTKGLAPAAPMKDSGAEELGEVPAHWEVSRLKFVARIQTGVAKGKTYEKVDTCEVPYLRVANVQDGWIDVNDVATIELPVGDIERYRLQAGDVLMNEGGDFDKLGRGAIWDGAIDPCVHQNHVFSVRPVAVSPEWLDLTTSSSAAQFFFKGRSKQSTNLASISSTNLMELPLLVPPAHEQANIIQQVTQTRSRLDDLISAAEAAITLLQERRAALISAAVTGKIDVRGLVPAQAEAA